MTRSLMEAKRAVEERIAAACARAGRRREDVRIVAVTKYASLERTEEALRSGLTHIGENRWQDAKEKWEALGAKGLGTWHFIGHLQTNKVKDVVGRFHVIHSLDRLSLAEEVNKRASKLGIRVPCFVQVNVSGEQTKHGLNPDGLFSFLERLRSFPHIEPIGLMTMAPYEADPERTRPVFRELRRLRDEANRRGATEKPLEHLSMGMSNDFEIAVEEGATYVRLGSVLMGNDG